MNQALLLSYTVGSLLGPSFTAMLMQNYSDSLLFIMIASVSFIYLLTLLRRLVFYYDGNGRVTGLDTYDGKGNLLQASGSSINKKKARSGRK